MRSTHTHIADTLLQHPACSFVPSMPVKMRGSPASSAREARTMASEVVCEVVQNDRVRPWGAIAARIQNSLVTPRPQHSDTKDIQAAVSLDGTESVSLQVALNHRKQLTHLLGTAGIDPNAADADGDRRPLHWAAARGHNECLQLLLKHGADAKLEDAAGRKPIDLAIELGQADARLLLQAWGIERLTD